MSSSRGCPSRYGTESQEPTFGFAGSNVASPSATARGSHVTGSRSFMGKMSAMGESAHTLLAWPTLLLVRVVEVLLQLATRDLRVALRGLGAGVTRELLGRQQTRMAGHDGQSTMPQPVR